MFDQKRKNKTLPYTLVNIIQSINVRHIHLEFKWKCAYISYQIKHDVFITLCESSGETHNLFPFSGSKKCLTWSTLTVLRSQRTTIAEGVHRSPGSHRTEETNGTRELQDRERTVSEYGRDCSEICDTCVFVPPAPFHSARKPSSCKIFLKQSITPE